MAGGEGEGPIPLWGLIFVNFRKKLKYSQYCKEGKSNHILLGILSMSSAQLAPFYGSESVHANAIQPLAPLPTKQSIYVAGVPHLITEDIPDRVWTYSQSVHKNEGDLILVHQNTIEFNDVKYTVDYITTLNNGVWYQYTVIYNSQFADTPLPHTIDFRFKTNEALSVPHTHIPSSSSSFRAAAYASMNSSK